MSDLIPPSVSLPDVAEDDQRVGHLLGADATSARVVLVGFPTDVGVRRNGGRPGAAEAPAAIREQLYRLTPDARDERFAALLGRTVDLGDVPTTGNLAADQERLGAALAPFLRAGVVPVVLGGGHETAYGHFLGYVHAERPAHIVNLDAHADVRPLREGQAHSGSPFRQALEHPSGLCRRYTVAGLQPHSTARAHLDYLESHGGRALWHEDVTPAVLDRLYGDAAPCMATFDLDAVDAAYAPGVSAPAVGGLSATTWLQAAYRAGAAPGVASMDVVELNPAFDQDRRTARLAALTVWHFLRGLAARPGI